MTDEQDLVTVVNNLTADERDRVKEIFDSQKIPFVVSGHGPSSNYQSYYYLFKVRQRDYGMATNIVKKQKAKIFIDSRKCPKCKALGYREIEKAGFWERIFYLGTTLVECKKCKQKFSI